MDWLFSAMVIDDDTSARNILEKFLETDGRVNVLKGLDSAVNALEAIEKADPDVIFLDINMPYEDGLQFASRLKLAENCSLLIFCTAFRNYAIDAFEFRPFDFLIKPFGVNEISAVIDNIVKEFNRRNVRLNKLWSNEKLGKYKFRVSNGYVFLRPSEILLVKCSGNFCELYTTSGTVVKLQLNLTSVYEYLDSQQFFKLNRSVIVNIDYITTFEKKNKSCYIKYNNLNFEFILSSPSINELENLLLLKLV